LNIFQKYGQNIIQITIIKGVFLNEKRFEGPLTKCQNLVSNMIQNLIIKEVVYARIFLNGWKPIS